jgi:hypothetical protein
MDMNLLAKPESTQIIYKLPMTLNYKRVGYELVCGIDHRFMTQKKADLLHLYNFGKIRLAWDWYMNDQQQIIDAIKQLTKAGYEPRKITVFMICNWKIPYEENLRKLDLLKIFNVKVCDCYYDNQTSPNIYPMYWDEEKIRKFRRKARKHNQLVNFRYDPQVSINPEE